MPTITRSRSRVQLVQAGEPVAHRRRRDSPTRSGERSRGRVFDAGAAEEVGLVTRVQLDRIRERERAEVALSHLALDHSTLASASG